MAKSKSIVDAKGKEIHVGSLHIRPECSQGVLHLCKKPSWDARPEFVEIVHG